MTSRLSLDDTSSRPAASLSEPLHSLVRVVLLLVLFMAVIAVGSLAVSVLVCGSTAACSQRQLPAPNCEPEPGRFSTIYCPDP